MIAIFTVLGLFLFGGGAYAIYDGWPYLVLERGFTQVIIGSIASSAGLIMLSLAWVLKEVRATRRALVEAMAPRPEESTPAAVLAEAPPVMPPRPEFPSFSSKAAPAAIGVVAGAAATGAVAHALLPSDDETPPGSSEAPSASADRDLFGALVTRNLEEPATESEPEAAPGDEQAAADEAEPLPDMFEEALSTAPLQPPPHSFAFKDEALPVEMAEAEAEPPAETETFAGHDAPSPRGDHPADERHVEEPSAAQAHAVEAPATIEDETELDEFSALRASLAGHLNEPEHGVGRIEPSFSSEPDPFAAAESWMDRASPRREPWLDTSAVEEQAAAEAEPPLWPPRTEAHAFDAPAEPAGEDAEAETIPDAAEPPHQHERPDAGSTEPEPLAAHAEPAEPQAEKTPAASEARPASDEGIVGAYQVGDAHFTIYADGSIQARTPDGEYSFASMDELKVYLASEKSRLGV